MSEPRRWHGQAAPIWGATPPPPRVRKYERLRVIACKPLDLFILNEQLEETWTHFVDDRTVFCTGPHEGCWLDHSTTGNARYGAWLAVQPFGSRDAFLLRLTGTAVTIELRLRELKGHLRGQHLQVWRKHGTEKSEMQCRLMPTPQMPDWLHNAIDVRYCVERMVKADDRPDGRNKPKWGHIRAAAEAQQSGQHPQLGQV
jgi:hypothetical protein